MKKLPLIFAFAFATLALFSSSALATVRITAGQMKYSDQLALQAIVQPGDYGPHRIQIEENGEDNLPGSGSFYFISPSLMGSHTSNVTANCGLPGTEAWNDYLQCTVPAALVDVRGGPVRDTLIVSTDGDATVQGRGGDDTLIVSSPGNKFVYGGTGNDYLILNSRDNITTLSCGEGWDRVAVTDGLAGNYPADCEDIVTYALKP